MKKEKKRIAVDDPELKAKIAVFCQAYRAKNGIDLTETNAIRLLLRAGFDVLDPPQLRLEDKMKTGALRK